MRCLDARSLAPVEQEQVRNAAVKLFLSGSNPTTISRKLSVSRQAVYNWLQKYLNLGDSGLKTHKQGRPKGSLLLPWQSAQIVKMIKNYCPNDLGLPFFLWTRESAGVLIFKKFQIRYSKWTVGRYLAKWGFTSQKPIKRAFEQNPHAIKKWFEIEYPLIQRRAKKEKAAIYWGDEMGLRSDYASGKTYGIKGQTPVFRSTGKRFSCNMISAITNHGKLYFMIYQEKFTEDIFIKFLKKLVRQVDRKLFLIVDRHPSHQSKKVRQWLTVNERMIRLEFLPPYCPELNPDELLNQDVKSNVGKKRAQNSFEMIKNLNSHLRMRQKQPDIIQKFVSGCHPLYAR